MDNDIAARIRQIAQEAKERNPEGFHDGSSVSSDEESGLLERAQGTPSRQAQSQSQIYVNPSSGQTIALLATAVNVPLYLREVV